MIEMEMEIILRKASNRSFVTRGFSSESHVAVGACGCVCVPIEMRVIAS